MKSESWKFIAALLFSGIAFGACDKTEESLLDLGSGTSLCFDSTVDFPTTRGTELTASTISEIGMWAYNTGAESFTAPSTAPNFMDNHKVVRNVGGKWVCSPAKYWPVNDPKISFFAYAPKASSSNNGISVSVASGFPSITYTVPDNTANHSDLLCAAPLVDKQAGSSLSLAFRHQLTEVAFNVTVRTVDEAGVLQDSKSQTVTQVTLKNIQSSRVGQFTASGFGWNNAFAGRGDKTITCDANSPLFFMPPQDIVDNTQAVIVYTNGTATVSLPTDKDWNAGGRITYNVTVTQTQVTVNVGDYFYRTTDGGWTVSANHVSSKGTCIGIVFSTSVSETDKAAGYRGYVVALNNAGNATWGGNAPADVDKYSAKTDLDGLSHMKAVEANIDSYLAFKTARDYNVTLPTSGTSGWYLPSIGQLWQILVNLGGVQDSWANYSEGYWKIDDDLNSNGYLSTVKTKLSNKFNPVGGSFPTSNDEYDWSSSGHSGNTGKAWGVNWAWFALSGDDRTASNAVRPVFAFK